MINTSLFALQRVKKKKKTSLPRSRFAFTCWQSSEHLNNLQNNWGIIRLLKKNPQRVEEISRHVTWDQPTSGHRRGSVHLSERFHIFKVLWTIRIVKDCSYLISVRFRKAAFELTSLSCKSFSTSPCHLSVWLGSNSNEPLSSRFRRNYEKLNCANSQNYDFVLSVFRLCLLPHYVPI